MPCSPRNGWPKVSSPDHASTFGGNLLATGVALEVLRVLVEGDSERAEHMGRLLVSRSRRWH